MQGWWLFWFYTWKTSSRKFRQACLLARLGSLTTCAQWLMWSPSSRFLFWFQVLLNLYWWLLQTHLGILPKLKSEVFDMFLAYKALVKKQYGRHILKLRSNNGGEYVNNMFITFCIEQGIQMQHIVLYTPQQNGVAERKNRALKEIANCMLQLKGPSLCFWAEAINCAN